jgi:hypothetical protein
MNFLKTDSEWKDRNEIKTVIEGFETATEQFGVQAAGSRGGKEPPNNIKTPGDNSLPNDLDTRLEDESDASSGDQDTLPLSASKQSHKSTQAVSNSPNEKLTADGSIQSESSSEESLEDDSEKKIRRLGESTSVLSNSTRRSVGEREDATAKLDVKHPASSGSADSASDLKKVTLKTVVASGKGGSSTVCRKQCLFDTYLWTELEKLDWTLEVEGSQRYFVSPFRNECFDTIHSVLWCLRSQAMWRSEPSVQQALKTYESHWISESKIDRKRKRTEGRLEEFEL